MMSKGKRIVKILTDENPEAILYTNMDDALIGIYRDRSNRGGTPARIDRDRISARIDRGVPPLQKLYDEDAIAVYSYVKFIEIYIKRDGMSEEEAVEFFDYNVGGGYIGELQPIVIDDTGV